MIIDDGAGTDFAYLQRRLAGSLFGIFHRQG